MTLEEALALVKRLIETGERHQDYARTVELADDYKILITGKGIEKKLIQFVQREDKALFDQRVLLTQATTPAVASSIRQPFGLVTRNNRIRKDIKLENEARQQAVNDMVISFFGSPRKKNRGLDLWMKSRFLDLQFMDPNSWVIVEWDAVTDAAEVVKPRPFEVEACQALNFKLVNDEVKWLFIEQKIKFNTLSTAQAAMTGTAGVVRPAAITNGRNTKEGCRYTLYDEQYTVVFEQVDPGFLQSTGIKVDQPAEFIIIKDATYQIKTFTPKVGYPTAFRIGYKRDELTKGRTFVNPWHDALCYFNKSLKTVSELDITMTLHVFPQKLQFVQNCNGPSKAKRCTSGRLQDGTECPVCKGQGYKIHTTAQDAILLPMPESKDDMIDLEKVLVYKSPPIELVKFQNEYTLQLESQAHQAVYNSQVFVKKGASQGDSGQPLQTATEVDYNMQSVYNALEPFTEKYSELWRDFVITFGILSGEKVDNVDVTHEFPADYKLKSDEALLAERKAANDSGAPGFLIKTIDDDLAGIVYAGDQLGMQKYIVRSRFFPFTGSTPDEIVALMASEFVPKEPKILYANFSLIFNEIEIEHPEFWFMNDIKKQREMVEEKVQEFMDRLEAQKPQVTINALSDTSPLNGDGQNPGDGNPGNADNNPANDAGADN